MASVQKRILKDQYCIFIQYYIQHHIVKEEKLLKRDLYLVYLTDYATSSISTKTKEFFAAPWNKLFHASASGNNLIFRKIRIGINSTERYHFTRHLNRSTDNISCLGILRFKIDSRVEK